MEPARLHIQKEESETEDIPGLGTNHRKTQGGGGDHVRSRERHCVQRLKVVCIYMCVHVCSRVGAGVHVCSQCMCAYGYV